MAEESKVIVESGNAGKPQHGSNGNGQVFARPAPVVPGGHTKYARVCAFCDQALLEPPTDHEGKLQRVKLIRLVRMSINGVQGGAVEFDCSRKEINPNQLAKAILDSAQDQADELGDTLTFEIESFHGRSDRATASIPLKITGAKKRADGQFDPTGLGELTETATTVGERSQEMRHREALASCYFKGHVVTLESLFKQLDRLEKANETKDALISTLQNERLDWIRKYEQTLSESQTRELERVRMINAERRRDEILKQVILLAPLIVNGLAGEHVIPVGNTSAFKELARGMVNSITVEDGQFDKLMNALKPMQKIAFLKLAELVSQEDVQQQKLHDAQENMMKGKANDISPGSALSKMPYKPNGAPPAPLAPPGNGAPPTPDWAK